MRASNSKQPTSLVLKHLDVSCAGTFFWRLYRFELKEDQKELPYHVRGRREKKKKKDLPT